jgi:hypothetical protein
MIDPREFLAADPVKPMTKEPLYWLLRAIKARCYIPSATHYAYYGGRGIGVCAEWRESPASFIAWAKANGWRRGLTIDRVDGDGDYSPENCRFVEHKVNCQKRRRDKLTPDLVIKARAMLADGVSVNEVRKRLNVPYMPIWHLANSGTWSNVA